MVLADEIRELLARPSRSPASAWERPGARSARRTRCPWPASGARGGSRCSVPCVRCGRPFARAGRSARSREPATRCPRARAASRARARGPRGARPTPGGSVIGSQASLGVRVLAQQGPPEGHETRPRRLVGIALAHRLERVEQNTAVASAGKAPAAVSEGGVVAPVHVLPELVARQPDRGAQPLEALPRVVDAVAGSASRSPASPSIDPSSWPSAMRRSPSGTGSSAVRPNRRGFSPAERRSQASFAAATAPPATAAPTATFFASPPWTVLAISTSPLDRSIIFRLRS